MKIGWFACGYAAGASFCMFVNGHHAWSAALLALAALNFVVHSRLDGGR